MKHSKDMMLSEHVGRARKRLGRCLGPRVMEEKSADEMDADVAEHSTFRIAMLGRRDGGRRKVSALAQGSCFVTLQAVNSTQGHLHR